MKVDQESYPSYRAMLNVTDRSIVAPEIGICAPVYGETLGLRTEVVIGPVEGVRRESSIRCDFLTLMFKAKLTGFVATLSEAKQLELKHALAHALQIGCRLIVDAV